jgi:ankyrin repeat protein
MRLLLQGRADLNAADSNAQTPLQLCLQGLRSESAALEAGSGVRVHGLKAKPEWTGRLGGIVGEQNEAGRWPVCIEGSDASDGVLLKDENLSLLADEAMNLLLEAGADVNRGNNLTGESRTLLHVAAHSGDAELAERLISKRAHLDQQDKTGLSALHVAARGKHLEIVRLLVTVRADATLLTASGKTALELAKTNRADAALLKLLSGEGGDTAEAPTYTAVPQPASDGYAGGFASLTAEQRAALFID